LTPICYKGCPSEAAHILADIGNRVADSGEQPTLWAPILKAKNEEGVVAFLDQEKAFDMVRFITINAIFTKLNWPE
jgi:hypothetical protein